MKIAIYRRILRKLRFSKNKPASRAISVAQIVRDRKENSTGVKGNRSANFTYDSEENMYCPKCALQNGDEVMYCRGCGVDLGSVRESLVKSAGPDMSAHFSERRLRRMKRRGIDATATPLTLASRAIDLQSGGVRAGMVFAGFAFVTAIIYSRPPIGGIFWLLWLIPTFIFFATSVSRFVQAAMIKKLLRETAQPSALPDTQPDYLQSPRSIYETDDLQPRSVTDATTRHLR